MNTQTSAFKNVFSSIKWSNNLLQFLQVIFHLYPEQRFYGLIEKATSEKNTDEEIYKSVQTDLKKIKPFLSELTLALPALKKQKKEMSGQVMRLLEGKKQIEGYLEIGSTGRYVSELRKHIPITGSIFLTNDIAPSNSLADVFERGQFKKIGNFIPLNNYEPINQKDIADESLDLVTCHIGLHHCTPEKLADYILSVKRILKNDGLFIIRDHDVKTKEMATFVSLVHTVFNLGLNVPWETETSEYKSFKSVDEWSKLISSFGFKDLGQRILQQHDPSENTLMSFKKI